MSLSDLLVFRRRRKAKEPTELVVPFVCIDCGPDPAGYEAHIRNRHPDRVVVPCKPSPDLVAILADYFTGPDLALCSIAMAAHEDTTARRRAERFFKTRDAFGIPREVDIPGQAQPYIVHALSRFVTDN